MIVAASLVVLAVAGALFGYRVTALNGLLVVGAGAIATDAVRTGGGPFIPVVVVLTLVGFVGTAMVARFIESRGR